MLGDEQSKSATLFPSGDMGEDPNDKEKFVNKPGGRSDKGDEEDEDSDEVRSKRAYIKKWQAKIKDAKAKWQPEFDRMKDNMDFVAGLQWENQKQIKTDKYVVNLTLRTIRQRVATLYAKDPKVAFKRHRMLDFQLWGGDEEEILQAASQAMMMSQVGMPVPPQTMALLNDYQAGMQHRKLVQRIGETLEICVERQHQTQEPKFKTQMKHLVQRVCVCGVGYIKPLFCRDYENELTHSETRLNLIDRAKMAARILEKFQDGKVDEADADMEKLREIVNSFQVGPMEPETTQVKEHIVLDFPQATSIIPDTNCRILRGFIGARWIAEEFRMDTEFVNAFFEKDIQPGVDVKEYGPDGQAIDSAQTTFDKHSKEVERNRMCLWQVYDLDTKNTFIIADGYKDYLMEPEVTSPSCNGFWQIVPVTFNDIEVVEGCNATPFPPSDVDLIRHPQMEYNRIKNSVRRHRIANRPRAMYAEGSIGEEDLDAIANSEDQEMIPLKLVAPGADISKVVTPLLTTPIEQSLYDTSGVQEDVLQATGNQEANIGPAQPNVTATVGTIAEQSRVSVASSDVDGLDDALSDVAQIEGEFILKEFDPTTVRRIAGPGAVFPDQNREDFLNEIELEIVAASSGRPNKAMDISILERVIPLIIQAATMPPQAQPTIQACIKQLLKAYDSNLEPSDFFPLPMPMMQAPPPPTPGGSAAGQPPPQAPKNGGGKNNANASRGQRPSSAPPKYQQQPNPKPQQQLHQAMGAPTLTR
jgi:hypothetical protein